MKKGLNTPTKYSEINLLVDRLSSQLQAFLESKLVGIYIYGSLVWGDFNYNTSDIDIFVALRSEIDKDDFETLNSIHQSLIQEFPKWHDRMEIA